MLNYGYFVMNVFMDGASARMKNKNFSILDGKFVVKNVMGFLFLLLYFIQNNVTGPCPI